MTTKKTQSPRRAPRAVKVKRNPDGQTKAETKKQNASVSMAPEQNQWDSQANTQSDQQDGIRYEPRKNKRWSLSSMFWSAFSGLLLLAFILWLDNLVLELFARWETLGWVGIGLVAITILALFIFLFREFLALRRLAHVDDMRAKVEDQLKKGDRKKSMRLAKELLKLYQNQPSLYQARQNLRQDLPHLFDSEDILAQTEKILMPPIDRAANHRVHQAAKRVALVTALSPRALFDIVVVLVETVRMVRAISELYGNHPGFVSMLRLSGHIAGHLAVTGGMAAGETLLQQIIGHGLAARLSAKLGEGLLNGILTARIGLATIALCRPMPFHEEDEPSLSAIIKALKDQSDLHEPQSEGTEPTKA